MEICMLNPADLDRFAHLFPAGLTKELPANELMLGCMTADPPAAAGILMAHVEELELIVDWLYVDEAFRRRGGARDMLLALMQASAESGDVDSASVFFTQDHEGLYDFLSAMGFLMVVRGKDKGFVTRLGQFPRFKNAGGRSGTFAALHEVDPKEMARFAALLDGGAIPDVGVPTPFAAEDYLPESMACLENGKIRALCLFSGGEDGLSIDWIYNTCSVSSTFIDLFNEGMERLKRRFPADTPLTFACIDEKVEYIVERGVPLEHRAEVYMGVYPFVTED